MEIFVVIVGKTEGTVPDTGGDVIPVHLIWIIGHQGVEDERDIAGQLFLDAIEVFQGKGLGAVYGKFSGKP